MAQMFVGVTLALSTLGAGLYLMWWSVTGWKATVAKWTLEARQSSAP